MRRNRSQQELELLFPLPLRSHFERMLRFLPWKRTFRSDRNFFTQHLPPRLELEGRKRDEGESSVGSTFVR